MATAAPTLLRHLRGRLTDPGAPALADGCLLRRFTRTRDEAAFAALVERHGPLVHGVARRVLADDPAAEDVFQATFLVLARKAGTIRRKRSLASWLFGVARRLACQARRRRACRERCERRTAARRPPSAADDPAWRELLAVLDEELTRLPDRLRAPVLLCHLRERTQDEAARELGWSLSTLRRRLTRARELLRVRLARRGATLGAGLFAGLIFPNGLTAAVPARLAGAAVRTALAGLRGGPVAPAVAELARPALPALSLRSVAAAAALAVVAAFGALAGGPRPTPPTEPPPAAARPPEGPAERVDPFGDPLPAGAVMRYGSIRLRHGGNGDCVDFSPDGKLLISGGSMDGLLRVWDAGTLRLLRIGHGHEGHETRNVLHRAKFSPDGSRIATAGFNDYTIRLWDPATAKEVRRITQDDVVTTVAWSPDGALLASGSWRHGTVHLWDAATGQQVRTFNGHSQRVFTVAFSPDGRTLASGGWEDKTVRLWDVATGKELRRYGPGDDEVAFVIFSPDGTLLATGGKAGVIHLWDGATGREVRTLRGHDEFAHDAAFTRDGRRLVSSSYDHTVRLWDVATGRELRTFRGHTSLVYGVAVSPDGARVASGGEDCLVRLWDVETGRPVPPAPGHQARVNALALTPDGRVLMTAGADGTVRFWDAASGRELRRIDAPGLNLGDAALSPDGRLLATGSSRAVVLWDAQTGRELRRPAAQPDGSLWRVAVAFTPDGTGLVFSGPGGKPHLADVATGRTLRFFDGPPDDRRPRISPPALAVSPDGALLAFACGAEVQVFELATGRTRLRQELSGVVIEHGGGVSAVAFPPDGRSLAVLAGGGDVLIIELAAGRERARLKGVKSAAHALAFSPDGSRLAVGSFADPFAVYHLADGSVRPVVGECGGVNALAFSRDGRSLFTANEDTTALRWDLGEPMPKPAADLSAAGRDACWADLADADAARAFAAINRLAADPAAAVDLLSGRLTPAAPPDPQRLTRLVTDLDSPKFADRQRAMRELEGLGLAAEEALRDVLKRQPSAELRRRAEQLLERLNGPELWRTVRAVEVLERVGTPAAQDLLKRLAGGQPGARLTQEASAALGRLQRRP
jgi:RNA polymerase sigma factor (sigma-70 family)